MIKLKRIKYGLDNVPVDFGGPTFMFEFEEDDRKEEDIKLVDNKTADDIVAEEMYNEAKKMVEEQGLEKAYLDACVKEINTLFIGTVCQYHISACNKFFELFQKDALNQQRNVAINRLRPPYMMYECEAQVYTASEQFYENFNAVFCHIDENTTKETLKWSAIIEVAKHRFSTLLIKITSVEKLEALYKVLDEAGVFSENLSKARVNIIQDEWDDKVCDFCIEKKFKYFVVDTTNPKFVQN